MIRKLFVIVLGLALLGGVAVAKAGNHMELRVQLDFNTFDAAHGDSVVMGAAFYVTGNICEELDLLATCTPIGTFQCWGWLIDADDPNSAALVSQEFKLNGRGNIQVQGVEDEGPRAVVGGTGEFKNVRGEATGFDLSSFLSDGEFTGTFMLSDGMANTQRVQQTSEMIDFDTGAAERGGGVLTRNATTASARLSMMGLRRTAAYSVWWVVFNAPEECLTPWHCGESDFFAGGGLNEVQINAAKISVFYAAGFVTGRDGIANVMAPLRAGLLPEDTFVNFGWVDELGDSSGLEPNNGLIAELHLVIRHHGSARSGSVGVQTSAFNGLCDVQTCANQLAIVFPSPAAP